MSLLPQMYRHMAWADERTMQSLRDMTNPPAQALDLFSHIVAAEHEWLSRILGKPGKHGIWPKLSLERSFLLARENHAALTPLAAEANGAGGQRLVTYRNSSGAEHTTSLQDILLHVAHHGVYHRGQVALLVRASGGNAVGTDYILFARE
ncbi:MAG: damage-inducible protein DinB [Phycisphaerae bacterium]|nr:damage-inducible protein DinB [Gemmatimonadaceae bacterium]